MLDREGLSGPEDIAIIGSAGEVQDRINAMANSGITTMTAAAFGSKDELAATRAALVEML